LLGTKTNLLETILHNGWWTHPQRGCVEQKGVCVECLIGKQKKPILFKVTEPSVIRRG